MITLKYGRRKPSLDFRLKQDGWNKRFFFEKIKHNKLIRKNHKNTCATLNYTEHLLICTFTFFDFVPLSAFASLVRCSCRN